MRFRGLPAGTAPAQLCELASTKSWPGEGNPVRGRLVDADPVSQERLADPLEAIDWPFAKEVIDLKIVILIRETGKVILRRARDLSSA